MSDTELGCELEKTWKLDGRLADRLGHVLEDWLEETRMNIAVISGFRTVEEQLELARSGRPAAPPHLSTHTLCPATGADVRINGFVTDTMKARFGRIVVMNGLRWGGGSTVSEVGIPSDWNHVDLGPRA